MSHLMLQETLVGSTASSLPPPTIILFDWHATLVDTSDAMYNALDDLIPRLPATGLLERLVDPELCRSIEDAKLVNYVREHRQLHPKLRAERKVSRSDIFEVLFGPDEDAKRLAHEHYNECYRSHYGEVHPFEHDVRECLLALKGLGLKLGVASNRNREYIEHELRVVDDGGWIDLFDSIACGDDVARRKPAPDVILRALSNLGVEPDAGHWYVGDSTTDIACAKLAGITSCFYNGAHWDRAWLDKIFPSTPNYPHKPDVVVARFDDLLDVVTFCLGNREGREQRVSGDSGRTLQR